MSITTGAMRARRDPLGRGDAVQPGHLDVEDDEVGPVLLGQRDGLLAVARLGDDLEALLLEHLLEVQPDQRLVLGDDDASHGRQAIEPSRWQVDGRLRDSKDRPR